MVDAGAQPTRAATDRVSVRPLIELDSLTKRYGALAAVDNVSMQVPIGEVRAVIGPNGAGKTTLFHLITGVVKPTAGRVRFADEDITGLPAHIICQRGLSRTFQLTSLFP
jgi:branched-chain amino acid transport system ATP-binding protein